ncbi:hypothetical protein SUGI_1158180, partial [Cryptomeria japonica]
MKGSNRKDLAWKHEMLGEDTGMVTYKFCRFNMTGGAQPSLEGTGWNREKHEQARIAASNFWFYNNLSFNAANNVYWEGLVNALTVVGKGFKAPIGHDFNGPLLEKAVKNTQIVVDDQKRLEAEKIVRIVFDEGFTKSGEELTAVTEPLIYKSAEGRLFSSQLAIDGRGKQQPDL